MLTAVDPQALNTLHMHQRVTFMVNRYEIFADDGNGTPGEMVAFAEQKRAKLKEQVTIFTDSSMQQVLAGFRARKVIDLGSGYEVTDGTGTPIGGFRKAFGKSLLNSTWYLDQPGIPTVTGRERSKPVAIVRRLWDFIPYIGDIPFPIRYHFDFASERGESLRVNKKTWIRDHYRIDIADQALDRRVVIAQAIALDALQSR